MLDFRMPQLGADMDEGILLEWKVAVGDSVKKGDIVAVVETTKGAIDIEVFVDGVIEALLVEPGVRLPVGAVMARLRASGETESVFAASAAPTFAAHSSQTSATASTKPSAAATRERSSTSQRSSGPRATPCARRLAKQLQIDISAISGSGPGGSIVAADVEAATQKTAVAHDSAHGKTVTGQANLRLNKQAAMRNTIAAAMCRSKREIPHYYLAHDVDVSALVYFVERWNDNHAMTERLLPTLLYYKAIGLAASEFESLNGYYADEAFQPANSVNVGVAIRLRGGGLVAPCLFDVAQKSSVQLMIELKDLVKRARKGGLRASELGMGTITVSNLGDRGVDFLAGVIYPPQVALVGIGGVRQRAWVVDNHLAARPIVRLSLAADHRVSDGHTGALFLRKIEKLMENPDTLM